VASPGRTVHTIDTLPRCHPEQSFGSGVHSKVTLGAAGAADAQRSVSSQTRVAASVA
jgi:hypothetical protein